MDSRLQQIQKMLESEPNDSFLNYALALEYAKANETNSAHMTMIEKGYFNITKVGLIGFAAGFPLSYFTRIKRYQITDNKIKNDKDFWYLSKETAY